MTEMMPREDIWQVIKAAEGFYESSVLLTLVKLRVIEHIGHGVATAPELAERIGTQSEPVARLLRAGVALDILESEDGRSFGVTGPYRFMLVPGAGPMYMGDWVRNLEYFRDAMAQLDTAVLNAAPAATYVDGANANSEHIRVFAKAMHNGSLMGARELAGYLDTSGVGTLLDLGCGPGTYGFTLAEANPALRLHSADLPEVLDVAREIEASYQISSPVTYHGVDLRTDMVEGTFDLILVSNTLHMLGEKNSRSLLSTLYPLVNPGGSIVVQANFLDEDRLGPRWPALLDLIQLCITESGRNHTVGETLTWLAEAGFTDGHHVAMSEDNLGSYVQAWKR
jgi:SAM-dependent methyltransferase